MHYHHSKTRCLCHLVFTLAVACFALESLFPHVALAQTIQASVVDTAEYATPLGFPTAADKQPRYTMRVLVTAYSSTPDQTDSTPFTTANGTTVHPGVVAANWLPFGTHLRLPKHFDNQVFVVADRMNKRFANRLDIWMESREAAVTWGARYVNIEVF